ncbi:two-component sensor histidine kinase [Tersicoccus phoenicis]|uniref:Signal transduction histidine-protein kinase/phosphatase MprB n=1 Tax=Tersicoccus phoenicis TaxID=554083 RepID=A0A1R1LD48_9MICC|nr:HAMP domain-containing sensor histidine kinase [Tersicoccus phoenicis]OMH25416.1 two-component sensor histidine kinase [Tersicoccus phoenicis]
MRVRVLGILSLFSVLIVVAVAASILTSVSRELTQELQINRVAALNRFAQLADDAVSTGDTSQLQRDMNRYSQLYGEGIVVHTPQATLTSGGLSPDRADVRDSIGRARLNLADTALAPVQPFGPRSEVIARSFGTASQVLGEAALDVDLGAARQKLRERWLLVVLAAVAGWTLLLLGAARVTGWVLRPVHRLTDAVAAFEESGRATRLREEGPPELQRLSRAFSAMAEHVAASMDSQRQLIADASHQLRNPVGALRLRADLLALELDAPAQRAAAAGLTRELEHVEGVLDGVLRLAAAEHRVQEGAVTGAGLVLGERAQHVDPWPVLQEAVERAEPAAVSAGARLELAPPPSPSLRVVSNRSDLADMVDELIGNAVKYAPGATIRVGVRAEAGRSGETAPGGEAVQQDRVVALVVTDDGPGLSEQELAAATTRFWRSPQHSATPGTGLGLAIVARLAEANGARLVLATAQPHGLVARVEFRATRQVPASGPGSPDGDDEAGRHGRARPDA